MAGRVLSRRALRDVHDQAERIEEADEEQTATETDGDGDTEAEAPKAKKTRARKTPVAKVAKPKAPAKPRVRKKAVKVAPRMFARWAVCDGGLKRLAIFEYKDRAGADAKLAEMLERKPGAYFLQMVKDAYNPPVEEVVQPEVVAAV
jgi:hypothetical protein